MTSNSRFGSCWRHNFHLDKLRFIFSNDLTSNKNEYVTNRPQNFFQQICRDVKAATCRLAVKSPRENGNLATGPWPKQKSFIFACRKLQSSYPICPYISTEALFVLPENWDVHVSLASILPCQSPIRWNPINPLSKPIVTLQWTLIGMSPIITGIAVFISDPAPRLPGILLFMT